MTPVLCCALEEYRIKLCMFSRHYWRLSRIYCIKVPFIKKSLKKKESYCSFCDWQWRVSFCMNEFISREPQCPVALLFAAMVIKRRPMFCSIPCFVRENCIFHSFYHIARFPSRASISLRVSSQTKHDNTQGQVPNKRGTAHEWMLISPRRHDLRWNLWQEFLHKCISCLLFWPEPKPNPNLNPKTMSLFSNSP